MIKVLSTGIYNTVQDQGRFGYAKMGIPNSGILDSYAADLGNALLGNSKNDAVVEITFGQGKFQFTTDTIFCLTGADFSPKLNDIPIKMNCLHKAPANAILSFGRRNYGARTYLAVQGGIQTEQILGSRSFSKGITQTRLEKDNVLNISKQNVKIEPQYASVKVRKNHFTTQTLPCFSGPEFNQLNQAQKQLLSQPFSISMDNNRVGYRLNEPIENNLPAILTSSVLPGTVQLTPSGKLIVLMKDCQVTGGYPRILQLSDHALSILSQKVAGEKIRFDINHVTYK